MIKLKYKDIPEQGADLEETVEKLVEEQSDPEFIVFVLSGLLMSPEEALGFLLCYATIHNALIRQETEQLEDMFRENA